MTPIQWNVTGPQGATGATGPQGATGQTGAQGPRGASFVTSDGAPTGTCTTGDSDVDYTTGEEYQCQGGSWTDTGNSLQGPPGLSSADGEVCPADEYVDGFDVNGNISCAPLPATTIAICPANDKFTFNVTSVKVGALGIDFWEWPGGTMTLTDSSNPGCSVTVEVPHGLIDDIGGTREPTAGSSSPGRGSQRFPVSLTVRIATAFRAVASPTATSRPALTTRLLALVHPVTSSQ
jgi:hypothetical protein